MMNLTISIVQIQVQPERVEENLRAVTTLFGYLPPAAKHIVVLPELWSTGFVEDRKKMAKINDNLVIPRLKEIAKQKNLTIFGSYIQQNSKSQFTNQLKIIQPNNDICISYNKIHLFSQMNEVKWFVSGKTPVIAELFGIRIGLSICYDLRFPDLFTTYANNGAEIIILPCQWPTKRISHFNTLLKARAIENQLVVAASNVSGKIGNTAFGGQSQIIDHMGNTIADAGEELSAVLTRVIDLTALRSWRKTFPALKDRQIDVYPNCVIQ
ncbi:MAG: hypothetical protein CVU39_03255 [Chloroflexi bacterium HGW-Chloroflexi-10]|nr:MAG: hypothetical protein CVU39_03255 [Chloroflexi bacterium HGW-Chloroflexi-10]